MQVPFFSRPTPGQAELDEARAEFSALEMAASQRLERMRLYRDEGNRVRDPNLNVNSADLSDYGRVRRANGQPKRHSITLPLGKAMTVKHAYRIVGQLPDVVVDQRDDSVQERHRSDMMEKIVWAVMRKSKVETSFSSASWNASEVGAGCLDLYWDYEDNMPVFRSVDPAGILEVQGVDDPHDFQRVYRSWDVPLNAVQAQYRNQAFRGEPIDVGSISARHNDGGVEMVRLVQLCDRQKVLRFALSGDSNAVGLYEFTHNYGFVPYVVIPNIGPYEDVWGWADYEFVRALAEYIPLLFSREADVLRAVAAGSYQDNGSGIASNVVAKIIREGGVAITKRDSEIKPIQPAQMPEFAESHADRAMQMLKMLGFAPDAAWGLPGSGSGSDRGLQLQPLLEYTAMKQLNWQSALSRLFAMTYRMIEQKMIGTSTYRGAAHGRAGRRTAFSIMLGPDAAPLEQAVDTGDILDPAALVELPRTPKDLFDGDYEVRFVWRNRVDPEDPAYVMSELNKFQQGVQSLETTLENLGVQAPEDEMKRIEKEAERFPWINQGMVKLLQQQLGGSGQGAGGGAPPDTSGSLSGALETMGGLGGGESGALNADAGASALGPGGIGQLYGGA